MPVGALIGGGLSLVGSVIGGSSQKKAANKAADTSMAVAQQNNALARDIYGQNKNALSPYIQRGNAAGATMNALLGLGGPAPQASGANALAMYQGGSPDTSGYRAGPGGGQWDSYLAANPDVAREYYDDDDERSTFASPQAYAQWHYRNYGQQEARALPSAAAPPGGSPAQSAAENAFDVFRNSTGYQFRLGEGLDAVNSNAFGAGVGQSGAALKALTEYGQNFASNEFGNYMGYLGNQQGVGLGAGSALAGVGQNYVNTVGANNNSAGTAAANAALAGANNPFANALGSIGGTILGGVKW